MHSLLTHRSPGSSLVLSTPARLVPNAPVARVFVVGQHRRRVAPCAAPSSGGGGDKDDTAATAAKVDKVIEELKKTGMTAVRAKQILKTWAEIGVKDPEQLKKVLVQRSLAPIPSLAAQGLLDAVASFGGFYLGGLAAQGEDFPFRIGVEVLGYFFGLYYFVQCLLEVGAIGGLLYSTYRYGTNSAALLGAVQAMAGPASGLNVLDKASRVVNIFKVVTALETVAAMLRDEYENPPRGDSLRNLGAYLTLSQAKESLGFKPEAYGLSEKEAGNIAYAFATFDTNQNFKLEPSELGALCQSLGKEFDADELKEAVKILDANNTGHIEFNEFCNWWVKRNPAAQQQQPGAASAAKS